MNSGIDQPAEEDQPTMASCPEPNRTEPSRAARARSAIGAFVHLDTMAGLTAGANPLPMSTGRGHEQHAMRPLCLGDHITGVIRIEGTEPARRTGRGPRDDGLAGRCSDTPAVGKQSLFEGEVSHLDLAIDRRRLPRRMPVIPSTRFTVPSCFITESHRAETRPGLLRRTVG